MSISRKIGMIVAGSLVVVLGLSLLLLLNRSTKRIVLDAEENVRELKNILVNSTVFSMGEGITSIDPFIKMLKENPKIREIRLIPANSIRENSQNQMDADESEVFQSAEPHFFSEDYLNEPVIRTVDPIIANESCLQCHEGNTGDPLAVLSIRYSTKEIQASIHSQQWLAFILGLFTILLASGFIIFLVDRQIIREVKKLIHYIRNISTGSISNEIRTTRKDELGEAFKAMQILQDNIAHKTDVADNLANGNLEVEIQILSEEDVLGKAMLSVKSSLEDMQNDLISTIEAQKKGRLDTRCHPEKFKGSYALLLEGINTALEAIINPLQEVISILSEYARGNLDIKVRDFPGQQIVISQSMNTIRDNLKALVDEGLSLSSAAREGKLETRGDVKKFEGEYRKIIEGINSILENMLAPIGETIQCLESVSSGSLTKDVTGDYLGDHARIKNALNDTIASLNDFLSQVSNAVEQLSTVSLQVSDASQSVSQGATEQAGSLEEITSSMAEIGSQSRRNAENAAQANQLSTTARNSAETGNGQMKQMLQAMEGINESSGQISKIIKVIDEIAFQTNLLALNAAVEAARAGVHGKGFAVVAEEVRNLAQRSAKAARETTELIEGSLDRVENGTKIANQTAHALDEIIQVVTKVTDLVGEIANASKEQVQGLEQVNQALVQVDQVTQSNAASAEESASAAEELSGQVVQLKGLLEKYQLKENSGFCRDAAVFSETEYAEDFSK
ncbi:MAG: methyl-accepting chemotaxis protein [Calditrichia bacterium]